MCYAYYDDFERRTKKDSARKPETTTEEARKEPVAPAETRQASEGTFWTFLATPSQGTCGLRTEG